MLALDAAPVAAAAAVPATVPADDPVVDGYAARRAVALSNVRHFRRLARLALRDGQPGAESRAANARRAAGIVLAAAKREAKRYRTVRGLLAAEV